MYWLSTERLSYLESGMLNLCKQCESFDLQILIIDENLLEFDFWFEFEALKKCVEIE